MSAHCDDCGGDLNYDTLECDYCELVKRADDLEDQIEKLMKLSKYQTKENIKYLDENKKLKEKIREVVADYVLYEDVRSAILTEILGD